MLEFNIVVEYDIGIFKGTGTIVGVSSIDRPDTGITYIIKDLSGNVPNEVYKYDTFTIYECYLKIDNGNKEIINDKDK